MNETLSQNLVVSDAQRRQLDEDGYFITPVVFDDATLDAMRREFQRLWDEDLAAAVKSGDPLTIELTRYRPFFSQLDHRSPICRDFCHHRVFQDLARQIIGPDADMTWNQAILKPPHPPDKAGYDFAWHQDQWYALKGPYANDCNLDILREPCNAFTTWVAISRTTVNNGTLWVLPGRHKEGLLPHVWNESRREWRGEYDSAYKIPVVMRPGQVLVFRKYLPHSSGANVSRETRMAYQIGYTTQGLKHGPSQDLSPLIRHGAPV